MTAQPNQQSAPDPFAEWRAPPQQKTSSDSSSDPFEEWRKPPEASKAEVDPSKSEYSAIPYAGPTIRGVITGGLAIPGTINSLMEASSDYIIDKLFNTSDKEKKEREESRSIDIPTLDTVQKVFDWATGGALKPQSPGEKIAGSAGEFVGGSVLPIGRGAKTAESILGRFVPSAQETVAAAGGGASAEVAKQNGMGPGGQLISALLGGGAAAKSLGLLTNPAKELANTAFVTPKSTPEIQDTIKAAQDLGITLPYSSLTKNATQKIVEKSLRAIPYSMDDYRQLFNKGNKEYIDSYKNILDNISTRTFADEAEAGSVGQEAIKENANYSKSMVQKSYDDLNAFADNSDKVFKKTGLLSISKKLINQLNDTILPSTEEASTKSSLENFKQNLASLHEDSGGISLKNLLATERSLNDIINWETQGGSKNLLKALKTKVTGALDAYSNKNQEFGDLWNGAKKTFGDSADTFRNDLISSIMRQQKPELTLSKMSSLSGIAKVNKSLSVTPEGAEVAQALNRFKLEQLIGRKVINAGTGEVRYDNATTVLADPHKAPMIKALVGADNYQRIQNLQKVSDGFVKGYRDFANNSHTADVAGSGLSYWVPLVTLAHGLVNQDLATVALAVGAVAAPKLVAKALTNKTFLQEATKTALAGKSANRGLYIKSFQRMTEQIQSMLKEMQPNTDKQDDKKKNRKDAR